MSLKYNPFHKDIMRALFSRLKKIFMDFYRPNEHSLATPQSRYIPYKCTGPVYADFGGLSPVILP
jgi:hypothetical protein